MSQLPSRPTIHPPLWPLIRNELNFYARHPLCWLGLVLPTAFALLFGTASMGNDAQVFKQIALKEASLLILVMPLFVGVLAPLAYLREQQYQMQEIIGATPVSARYWCLSRMLGLFLLCGLILALMQLALLAGIFVKQSPEISPSLLLAMLASYLLQQLPAALLLCLLLLWCSLKWQKSTILYVLIAALYLGYPILAAATGSPLMANARLWSPELRQVMSVLDPYGVTPLMQQWLKGEVYLHWDAALLINRLSILALCLALLLASLRLAKHRIGIISEKRNKKKSGAQAGENDAAKSTAKRAATNTTANAAKNTAAAAATAATAAGYFSISPASSSAPALLSLVGVMLSQILRQRSSYFSLLLLFGLLTAEAASGLEYIDSLAMLVPHSQDALNRIMWDIAPVVGVLLLVLWSSRLCWLNKASAMHELLAATPVSNSLQLSAQLIAISTLSLLWLLIVLAAPALAQLINGVPFQISAYAQQAMYAWPPLLGWGLLLVACHALCRTPLHALLLIALLFLLSFSPLPGLAGLEHPLWRILQTPLGRPDLLWGFQASASTFWPFMLFGLLLVASFLSLAWLLYHRGTGFSREPFSRSWPLVPAALCLAVAQGLYLDLTLRAELGPMTSQARQAQRADYEKTYLHWQSKPQPRVTKISSEIDFYPAEQRAQIKASFTLQNQSQQPIAEVLVGQISGQTRTAGAHDLQITGAKQVAHDARLGQTVFQFDTPLPAGQTATLQVQTSYQQSGLQSAQMHQVLRADWSYLRMLTVLPVIGFVPELRLRNPDDRAKWQLPALGEQRPSQLFAEPQGGRSHARYDWVEWESVVSSPPGMQVITQGSLKRQWQSAQRQYFHYHTSEPMRNIGAFVLVPWQPRHSEKDGVTFSIYSPYYNAATELTQSAMHDTLAWFEQHIGRYPAKDMRLVMMPELERGSSAYALPQLILVNHRHGLRGLPKPDAGFDQVYRRAAHETAHQWFGHGIGNGVPQDGAFLIESLVKYVELVLIEKKYGQPGLKALIAMEQERFRFAQARSSALNKGLIDADESHDLYSRATLVFTRLRQTLGDEVIIGALRTMWQQHRYPLPPANSMDFVRILLAESPSQHHKMIRHLLLDADISAFLLPDESSPPNPNQPPSPKKTSD